MNYNTETDSTDSIFNDDSINNLFGGTDTNNNIDIKADKNIPAPVLGQFTTYKLPMDKEDIGLPVYLAGLIQLIVALIFISKKKIFLASITFFTVFIWMFNVHCVYAGKAYMIGKYNATCRSFSYALVLFPLFCIMLVLYDDYRDVWNSLKFNPGGVSIKVPSLTIDQSMNNIDNDDEDDSCDTSNESNQHSHSYEHEHHDHDHNDKKDKSHKKVEGYENINLFKFNYESIN